MGGLFGGGGSTISTTEPRLGALNIQTSSYGQVIPLVYGRQRISGNLIWYGDFTPIAHTTTQTTGGKGGGGVTQQNTTYTYQTALAIGLCEGLIVGIGAVWKDKTKYADLVAAGGMSAFLGAMAQAVWGHLTTNHPAEAIGYSETAYVAHASYDLGGSANLGNHNFEVLGPLQFSGGIVDADPKAVVMDLLTHATHGAGFPAASLGDLTAFSDYCIAAGLFISPALTNQKPAQEHLLSIVQSVNCEFVYSEGLLKIIPRASMPVTGNGHTFTPDNTPLYDLTDDDFLDTQDAPVLCRRTPTADAFNAVQIEYADRANDYNIAIAEAKDQANIEAYGLRQEDVQTMHWITTAAVAQQVAQARLQQLLYIRNEYEFDLGWNYARLEPMDIITITDADMGLDRFPVRIFSTEENDQGDIHIVAREFPIGVADPALYASPSGGGFASGWNTPPGAVNAPLLFEPPLALTGGSNEVWAAVSGGADWGGCNIWVSLDNATYQMIGSIYGDARYGTLNAALSAPTADPDITNTLTADLNTDGQILPSSQAAVDALASLCYVGGELLAYRDASLITNRRYALSYLHRGLFGTAAGAHNAGVPFARLDQALFQYAFNSTLIGQVIYFKFTSFNAFGQAEESLANVTAYNRTLTGGSLTGPANLALQSPFIGLVFKTQWTAVLGATSYDLEIWSGGGLRRSTSTTSTTFTYAVSDAIADGGPWRDYTVKVRAVTGAQLSAFSQINISNPTPAAPTGITTASNSTTTIDINWSAIADIDLQGYQVWISTTSGFTPDATTLTYTGTATAASLTGLTTGTTYYLIVAARDQWGTATLNLSAEQTQVTL